MDGGRSYWLPLQAATMRTNMDNTLYFPYGSHNYRIIYYSQPPPLNQAHVAQSAVIQNRMGAGGVSDGKHIKPKGPLTAYAFFMQSCREEYSKLPFAELSRKCAERWNAMQDKQQFHEMAKKDKQRYELEMQRYVPPIGTVEGRTKKRKQIKDPNAPKRPLTAFFWYSQEERPIIKTLHPEYGMTHIAKELGRRWSNMSADEKQKYEQMAEKDMQRYEQEMIEYKLKCKTKPEGGMITGVLDEGGCQYLPQQASEHGTL